MGLHTPSINMRKSWKRKEISHLHGVEWHGETHETPGRCSFPCRKIDYVLISWHKYIFKVRNVHLGHSLRSLLVFFFFLLACIKHLSSSRGSIQRLSSFLIIKCEKNWRRYRGRNNCCCNRELIGTRWIDNFYFIFGRKGSRTRWWRSVSLHAEILSTYWICIFLDHSSSIFRFLISL